MFYSKYRRKKRRRRNSFKVTKPKKRGRRKRKTTRVTRAASVAMQQLAVTSSVFVSSKRKTKQTDGSETTAEPEILAIEDNESDASDTESLGMSIANRLGMNSVISIVIYLLIGEEECFELIVEMCTVLAEQKKNADAFLLISDALKTADFADKKKFEKLKMLAVGM